MCTALTPACSRAIKTIRKNNLRKAKEDASMGLTVRDNGTTLHLFYIPYSSHDKEKVRGILGREVKDGGEISNDDSKRIIKSMGIEYKRCLGKDKWG